MKDQYFGDVNDYRKYGLLRTLSSAAGLRMGVWWMLTPPEDRRDGEFRGYLDQPARWRDYDPELYDRLIRLKHEGIERGVRRALEWELIPGALFDEQPLVDDPIERRAGVDSTFSTLSSCPLLFFDPDNGIEVRSVRFGQKRSSKYVYWHELAAAYARGHSLVIYQHFRRVNRTTFIGSQANDLRSRLGAVELIAFRTAHVRFWVVPQPSHAALLKGASERVGASWTGQIEPSSIARQQAPNLEPAG